MTPKRTFFVLCATLFLLTGAIVGGTVQVLSLLKTQSEQLAANRAQIATLNKQQNGIASSKRDIAQYSPLGDITKSIVPQDKDQAEAVRQITKIAAASGVTLTTMTFPSSTLGAKTAAPAANGAAISQVTPVPNIPGVYNLQITMSNNQNNPVSFTQLNSFLRGLENNRRTATVSSISIQPQAQDPSDLVFSLVTNIYIKP